MVWAHVLFWPQDLAAVVAWLSDQPSVTWLSPRMTSRLHNAEAGVITQVSWAVGGWLIGWAVGWLVGSVGQLVVGRLSWFVAQEALHVFVLLVCGLSVGPACCVCWAVEQGSS